MSYAATVFKVMIASPGDVTTERSHIREVLHEWNAIHSEMRKIVLLPVAWETHSSPEMGDRAQAIINKQLKDCDLLVGVFWTRIGTATGDYPSGTVEEIEEHIKTKKPTMLYFSSAPVLPDSFDPDQHSELKKFEESCKSRGLCETYSDPNEFKDKFDRQLQRKLNTYSPFTDLSQPSEDADSMVESTIPDMPRLSREAQILLKNASLDRSGNISKEKVTGGVVVRSNNIQFNSENNPRERATWEGATDELEDCGLIKENGSKRDTFNVTKKGYRLADRIKL